MGGLMHKTADYTETHWQSSIRLGRKECGILLMGGKTVSYNLTKILPSSSGLNLTAELTMAPFVCYIWSFPEVELICVQLSLIRSFKSQIFGSYISCAKLKKLFQHKANTAFVAAEPWQLDWAAPLCNWPVDLPDGLLHDYVRTSLICLPVLPGGACSLLSWKCVMQKEHQHSGSRVPAVRAAVSPNSNFR